MTQQLEEQITIRVANTPLMRKVVKLVSDECWFRLATIATSAEEHRVFRDLAGAMRIAVEPEQLTVGDVRSLREIRDDEAGGSRR